MITIRTIDAHVAGAPLRLVVDGFPAPHGATMAEKRAWASRRTDRLRRQLMLEPRGHADMCGAVLTEPTQPGSDAGLLFMDADGYRAASGHAVIAVATIAIERGLVMLRDNHRIVFDTPAGTVRAQVQPGNNGVIRVSRVSFTNVPSFVLHAGVDVPLPGRRLRADVAFGGEFYAIVDGESAGVPVNGEHLDELRRVGVAVTAAVEATVRTTHPIDTSLSGLAGTIFMAPPQVPGAALRSVSVGAGGVVDRSPSATATSAVMAVLEAMGLLGDESDFVHESVIGQTFDSRLIGRTRVGDYDAIVTRITGRAFITGEHTFVIADDDPLGDGFRVS